MRSSLLPAFVVEMSFFDGSSSSQRKDVNLGGKSLKKSGGVVETKEQLAERNAKARLQREHQRAENASALCISLSWRVCRAHSVARSRIQEVVEVALKDLMNSAHALSPNDLGPPAPLLLDQSIRALHCCFNVFMFLRKKNNHKLRAALSLQQQRVLDVLSSNLGAVFAFDGQAGVQKEIISAVLVRVSRFELSRVLRAVGSELLCSAVRDNSCPVAASALKLLSVPIWECLNISSAGGMSVLSSVTHHAEVAILLCSTGADAAQRGNGAMSQLLVSCCVTSTHAVQTAARSSASQSSGFFALSKAVADAWQSQLLHAPALLNMCPSVFHPQHSHSAQVWSDLLQSMLSSPAALTSTAVTNVIRISSIFKELRQTCQLIENLPSSMHELINRDVVAMFLHEVCPESMSDLATNAAAFTSWLRALSQAQLDLNQEMTRLLCNVVAPILRAAPFPKALPILNLCAFESPVPALLLAQNSV